MFGWCNGLDIFLTGTDRRDCLVPKLEQEVVLYVFAHIPLYVCWEGECLICMKGIERLDSFKLAIIIRLVAQLVSSVTTHDKSRIVQLWSERNRDEGNDVQSSSIFEFGTQAQLTWIVHQSFGVDCRCDSKNSLVFEPIAWTGAPIFRCRSLPPPSGPFRLASKNCRSLAMARSQGFHSSIQRNERAKQLNWGLAAAHSAPNLSDKPWFPVDLMLHCAGDGEKSIPLESLRLWSKQFLILILKSLWSAPISWSDRCFLSTWRLIAQVIVWICEFDTFESLRFSCELFLTLTFISCWPICCF